jgi:hypothetical protein
MRGRPLVVRLLAYADALGAGEALIGDVLEELGRGRSRLWVCQQLIGMFAFASMKHLRRHARLTPQTVALGFCVLLFAGVAMGSLGSVLEAWLVFYYMTGTLSLFAHMASSPAVPRPRVSFGAAAEIPSLE